MALKRTDYPDMTDEQWDALQADVDRERTNASKTARTNAERDAQAAIDAAVAEAIERERAKLEADEEGKLEIKRKELEAQEAKLAADRKTFAAKTKLLSAKIPEDKVDTFLSLFVNVDEKALDSMLDTFIKTYDETVKAQVDSVKESLLDSATPPSSTSTPPTDALHASQELLAKGDQVGAIDILLTEAGYTPTA